MLHHVGHVLYLMCLAGCLSLSQRCGRLFRLRALDHAHAPTHVSLFTKYNVSMCRNMIACLAEMCVALFDTL